MAINSLKRLPFSTVVVIVLGIVILGFSIVSLHVQAQSTGAPGADDEAENIPPLLRVEDYDGSGKQFKVGRLRVGSAQTLDLTAQFDVMGSVDIENTLLVAAEGSCSASQCDFDVEGQKFPPFLVRSGDGFVGIGTNNDSDDVNDQNATRAALGVFSQANQFSKGAVYATSTSQHSVYGKTLAAQKAGVFGVVSNAYSYAVYGKAVDIDNNGIKAVAPSGGTVAAMFKGNVLITGGFMQGNASGLIRVGSLNDGSLPAADGGRGIGVWATRQDISINAGESREYALTLSDGEVLRALDILVANQGSQTFRTYATHVADTSATDLQVSFDPTTERVTLQNNSGTGYTVRFVANIETGVSIQVTHNGANVSDREPILFEELSLYELTADVSAAAKNFSWEFVTAPARGQLCELDGNGNAVNCTSSGIISGSTIFYKQPAAYTGTPPAETIRVKWQGGVGNISRDFTLELIDLNAGVTAVEHGQNTQLTVTSTAPDTYTGSGVVVFENLTDPRPGESLSTSGMYNPPDAPLFDSYEEKVTVHASFDGKIDFSFDVYIVPNLSVTTAFPTVPGEPQSGQATSKVAINKNLSVAMNVGGLPAGAGDEYRNTTLSCTPASSCALSDVTETSATMVATAVGTKVLSLTWQPPAGQGAYPPGFSYVEGSGNAKEVYVSHLTSTGGGTGAPRTISFVVEGYQNGTAFLDNLTSPKNNITFTCGTCNPHIGANGNLGIILHVAPNTTTVDFITTVGGTYQVVGRNPNDLRETSAQTITVPGQCTNCSGCSTPACIQNLDSCKNCDDCCGQSDSGTPGDPQEGR